jgi:hypothetical protein
VAVDYLHRLIIRGACEDVRGLRRHIYREYPRTVGGHSWTEIVPFSFASLYEMAPAARRIEAEPPCDPYDISTWPIRRNGRRQAEVRYQLQTRNLEMIGLIRVLARALPSLTFTLATLCLDDSSIEVYRVSDGTTKKWVLPRRRREHHWDRARIEFGLTGDDVYDDDAAERWAEEEMLHEALTHWDKGALGAGSRRRYQWWNRDRLRDLGTEQQLALYEIAQDISAKPRHSKSTARPAVGQRKVSRRSRP